MTGVALRDIFIKTEQQPASKAERRAAGLPTHELMVWTDNAIVGIGRSVDAYRTSGRPEDIIEAESAAQTVQVLLAELRSRAKLSS